jgi:predicted nucleotidyltransferase
MHTESNGDTKYNSALLQRLNTVIPKIVDAFDPEEIIMYGSYARADNDIYSDIDIIIVADTNMRFQDRSLKAMEIIEEEETANDIPINPIVYTKEELEGMLKDKEGFLMSALRESVLVWKKDMSCDVQSQLERNEAESEFKRFLN